MKKRLILSFIATMIVSTTAIPVFAESGTYTYTHYENNTNKEYRKDDIRWVYQVIDGKLYKRKYNASKDEWIGDWIPC